ncbi:OmpH family outer membrane protein [Rhodanobacter sp. Si-c]|uniref:OmpH family outer membrane protein n=1 Tax=Rhodanobacter lycopersici TaxID=3162487 RepID=A0ABV3QJ40_9GAMM
MPKTPRDPAPSGHRSDQHTLCDERALHDEFATGCLAVMHEAQLRVSWNPQTQSPDISPMNMHRSLFVAALAAATGFSFAPVAPAQASAAPVASHPLGGKPVPGICMLSSEAVFTESKVGQASSERLKQLATQQQSLLEDQRKPLDAEIQAFQQKSSTLTEAQREQQGKALQQRMQAFQAQVKQLDQRIQLTRGKVMQQIGKQAQPLVESSYNSHDCGLLLNRDVVLGGNTANDLTGDVVRGLDAKITTLNFNLEPLPSGTGK